MQHTTQHPADGSRFPQYSYSVILVKKHNKHQFMTEDYYKSLIHSQLFGLSAAPLLAFAVSKQINVTMPTILLLRFLLWLIVEIKSYMRA